MVNTINADTAPIHEDRLSKLIAEHAVPNSPG